MNIPLSQGLFAIIDDADSHLSGWKWSAHKFRDRFYAMRGECTSRGRRPMRLHHAVIGQPIVKGVVVDHINGDSLDCRRSNLRIVTTRENLLNRKERIEGRTTSRFCGVHRTRNPVNPWAVRVKVNGMSVFVGGFRTEELAAAAHKAFLESLRESIIPTVLSKTVSFKIR